MANKTDLGAVQIKNEVIGTIASLAAQEVHGVAGIWRPFPQRFFLRNSGVQMEIREQDVRIWLSLIAQYGADLPVVAALVQDHVREMIDRMTHLNAVEVNVSIHHVKMKHRGGGVR